MTAEPDTATFVLIPGAGGETLLWHLLGPELRRRGHDVVAVELPVADDDAGLEAYADAVVTAAAAAGRSVEPVAVVALSMGGLTAPLVVSRLPVELLVMLNAMIPGPGETGGEWWTATGHAEARSAAALAEGWPPDDDPAMVETFFHDVPADITAAVMARGEPVQSERPFQDPWPLATWPDVETLVLAGRDDRFFPASFQRRVAQERLGLDVLELPGGHLLPLSQPVALAERLHRAWFDRAARSTATIKASR